MLSSLKNFAGGIFSRFFYWLPFLLLDIFDIWDKYVQPFLRWLGGWEVTMPISALPILLGAGILWAAFLTYHELHSKQISAPDIETNDWPVGDVFRIVVANKGTTANFVASAFVFPQVEPKLGEFQMVWESTGTNKTCIYHGARDYLLVGQQWRGSDSFRPHVFSITRYQNGARENVDVEIPSLRVTVSESLLHWEVMITSEPPMKDAYQGHYGIVGGVGRPSFICCVISSCV